MDKILLISKNIQLHKANESASSSLRATFKIVILLPGLQQSLFHLQMSVNLLNIIRHILLGGTGIENVRIVLALHVLLFE